MTNKNNNSKTVRKSFLFLLLAGLVLVCATYLSFNSRWYDKNAVVQDPNGCRGTKIGFEYPMPKNSVSFIHSALAGDLSRESENKEVVGDNCEILYPQEINIIPLDIYGVALVLGWLGIRFRTMEKKNG